MQVGMVEKYASVPHYLLPLLPLSPLLSSFPTPPCVRWEKYYGSGGKGRLPTCASKAGMFQTDQCRVMDELHPSLKGTWDRSMSELKWLESGLQCLVALVICFSLLGLDKSGVWGGASTKETGLWVPVLPSQQCWILLIVLCCWFISRWELFAVLHSFPNLLIHEILFSLLKSSLFWFCWASFMPSSNESFLIHPILTKLANF